MVVTNRVDGVKQFYFKDPDAYWLEINDAKE
jgi:lactoylglutathione lyase